MNVNLSTFTPKVVEEIDRILKKGNTAELKNENGKLVIVEVQRKAKVKT